MNNLHRELAPISDAAWAQIEEETTRTLKRYLAGRRVVDVQGPAGVDLSAIGTGHLQKDCGTKRRHRCQTAGSEVAGRAARAIRAGPPGDRRRRSWRERRRLATCKGRGAQDCVCRGRGGV